MRGEASKLVTAYLQSLNICSPHYPKKPLYSFVLCASEPLPQPLVSNAHLPNDFSDFLPFPDERDGEEAFSNRRSLFVGRQASRECRFV